jgi:hypothetical protein
MSELYTPRLVIRASTAFRLTAVPVPLWDKPDQSFETALAALLATVSADIDPNRTKRGPASLLHLDDDNVARQG